jgi:hypothetical protein
MILTTVLPYGRVALGPEAADVGFVEGALIQIVVLSTGSVLLCLDDTPPLEVPYRRGLGVRERKQLAARTARKAP